MSRVPHHRRRCGPGRELLRAVYAGGKPGVANAMSSTCPLITAVLDVFVFRKKLTQP